MREILDVSEGFWMQRSLAYDDVERSFDPDGDHSNILKLGTQEKQWRTSHLRIRRGPQQHFEIANSKK